MKLEIDGGWLRMLAVLLVLPQAVAAQEGAPAADDGIGVELPRPQVVRYELSNGLQVLLERDPGVPQVAGMVAYRVGFRDDPEGYSGLAHMVEHMTFRGSRHLRDGEAYVALERVGGRVNAYTTNDHTIYAAELPARHLPRLLWVESERMGFTLPAMKREIFKVEREVVVNEAMQRGRPGGDPAGGAVAQVLYPPEHPYHQSARFGADVEKLTFDDVRGFYQRHYRPDNASLVLVGDIDIERTRALIAKYFGPIRPPANLAAPRHPPAPAVRLTGSQQVVISADQRSDQVRVYWQVPCRDARCVASLHLIGRLLTASRHSPLRARLAEAKLSTTSTFAARVREQHTEASLRIDVHDHSDADEVLEIVDEELQRLRDGEVNEKRLRREKLGYAADALNRRSDVLARALRLALDPRLTDHDVLHAAMEVDAAAIAELLEHLPRDRRLVAQVNAAGYGPPGGRLEESRGSVGARIEGVAPRAADPPGGEQ